VTVEASRARAARVTGSGRPATSRPDLSAGGSAAQPAPAQGVPAGAPPGASTGLPPGLSPGRLEYATLGPFDLESGERLPALVVAYRHDGPAPSDAPQVLVVHALTGSADAAGDWWEPVIGEGRALDTSRYGILCANLLGGRYGSTGPTSRDPRTGRPYGGAFPSLSTRDQARAQARLLDALGIDRLALITGGSLGGMIALEIALERPASVDHVLPIAAPAATGPMAVAWNHLQVALIERLGDEGLSLARQLAMTTYRSEPDFDSRFGRSTEPDGRLSIVSYLEHQGRKLVDRFDGDTYRILAGAMDRHDIGRDRGGIAAALGTLAAAGTRLTGLGIEGDILYGPAQVRHLVETAAAAGVEAVYRELRSTKGHDAFLVEWDQLADVLAEALASA
jgi:homoserine O-acetyltransferase/O-succinyltransferase